ARRWGLNLPALALVGAPADRDAPRPRGRELLLDGARTLRLGGTVRAVAVDDRGRTAVAGWIARLDDPSIVLVPARR
ncbi:MAG TPA: hypothetical protein VHE35_34910, partial [Kofleriaceae bacterium]|nr:hypothetical protein [Kofleriaceae bacterium]